MAKHTQAQSLTMGEHSPAWILSTVHKNASITMALAAVISQGSRSVVREEKGSVEWSNQNCRCECPRTLAVCVPEAAALYKHPTALRRLSPRLHKVQLLWNSKHIFQLENGRCIMQPKVEAVFLSFNKYLSSSSLHGAYILMG